MQQEVMLINVFTKHKHKQTKEGSFGEDGTDQYLNKKSGESEILKS
jgi:hypothetical protein